MRAAQKLKSSMAKKEHGSSSGGSDAAAEAEPQSTRILADVPGHVPELPGAYLVRDEDLTQLKAALLMGGSASGTALTSKKQQNKVGAHGMVSSQWILFLWLMQCSQLTPYIALFISTGRRGKDNHRSSTRT